MPDPTYTGRRLELVTVREVHRTQDGALTAVTWDNGWTFAGIPPEHHHQFFEGRTLLVETVRLTEVVGIAVGTSTWLWRKSDQDLAAEHHEFVEGLRRQNQERWEEHHEDWARREAHLPDPLRRRLSRFRINGGHEFEIAGWGYELTVSELAVLYQASGGDESDDIREYAALHGTSGNQHEVAQVLARGLDGDIVDQDAIANFPSALTPITGDADYSKAGR